MQESILKNMKSIILRMKLSLEYWTKRLPLASTILLSVGLIGCQTPEHRVGFSRTFPYELIPYEGAPSQFCPNLNDIIDLSWINFGKQQSYDVVPY